MLARATDAAAILLALATQAHAQIVEVQYTAMNPGDPRSTHAKMASSLGPAVTPPSPLPPCTPAPPIDPLRCNPEEPAPAPPPIAGECDVEIRVDAVGFSTGQGWFEDRAEASASFTAQDLDTNVITYGRFPKSDTIKMEVASEHITSIYLGTYTVAENDHKDVRVGAEFIESDFPDKDDKGEDYQTIRLGCPQSGAKTILSADLCKGGDCTKLRGRMTADLHVLTADADRDCVENEDDYTPEPCDEAWKGQLCRASLVSFHYGDDFLTNLAQNLGTNLKPAMTGYDRVVLLIDDAQIGPFNLNPAVVGLPDVVMKPTEENFFASLQDLTARGCDIDAWIFSHGNPRWDRAHGAVSSGGGSISALDDDEHLADPDVIPDITSDELAEDTKPANSGTPSVPIRMTYSTACFYEAWNQTWLDAGAKVTQGSRDINFFPLRYEFFVSLWNGGQTYGFAAANEANAVTDAPAAAFIKAEGVLPPWLCLGNNTVVRKNSCAEDFFTDSDKQPLRNAEGDWVDGPDQAKYAIGGPLWDLAGITYDPNLSGAANMQLSSEKVRVGNPNIRKNMPATLTWP